MGSCDHQCRQPHLLRMNAMVALVTAMMATVLLLSPAVDAGSIVINGEDFWQADEINGRVFAGIRVEDGERVAIKVINYEDKKLEEPDTFRAHFVQDPVVAKHFIAKASSSSSAKDRLPQHIVRFFTAHDDETDHEAFVVMERGKSALQLAWNAQKTGLSIAYQNVLAEATLNNAAALIKGVALQTAKALEELHADDFVHLDLHMGNLVFVAGDPRKDSSVFSARDVIPEALASRGLLKLVDFEGALQRRMLDASDDSPVECPLNRTFVYGRLDTAAPEAIAPCPGSENRRITSKADIWAFGVLLWNLMFRPAKDGVIKRPAYCGLYNARIDHFLRQAEKQKGDQQTRRRAIAQRMYTLAALKCASEAHTMIRSPKMIAELMFGENTFTEVQINKKLAPFARPIRAMEVSLQLNPLLRPTAARLFLYLRNGSKEPPKPVVEPYKDPATKAAKRWADLDAQFEALFNDADALRRAKALTVATLQDIQVRTESLISEYEHLVTDMSHVCSIPDPEGCEPPKKKPAADGVAPQMRSWLREQGPGAFAQ